MKWLCKGEHGIWAGYGGKQKQTNADRIRAMTDDDLAILLATAYATQCDWGARTTKFWLEFLKQESMFD